MKKIFNNNTKFTEKRKQNKNKYSSKDLFDLAKKKNEMDFAKKYDSKNK